MDYSLFFEDYSNYKINSLLVKGYEAAPSQAGGVCGKDPQQGG